MNAPYPLENQATISPEKFESMTEKSMKVLLVEDNSGDARLLQEMFHGQFSHHIVVKHVGSMIEAEQYLADHSCDVFMIDLGLPDSHGLAAVRRARAAAPHAPLVVLTGLDDEALAVRALQEGAQDYLVKGQIETPGLLRALRYAIERKIIEKELNNEVRELKSAQAELKESELMLRLTLDASDQGAWRWEVGRGTHTLEWDARCKVLFGVAPDAPVNYAIWAGVFFSPKERAQAEVDIARALDPADTHDDYVCTYRVLHSDGVIFWIATAGRAVFEPDPAVPSGRRVVRILGTNRDESLAKRAELERDVQRRQLELSNVELERLSSHLARSRDEAKRANRAKSRFLAGMSHELRTPLNGILGYAHLLRLEGSLTVTQSARTHAMLRAGTHLLEMINRVLDLSEIEAGHIELQTAECNLRDIANTCLDFVRPPAEAKGLMLDLAMDPDAPCNFTTDPTRLRQVLVNLLGNAVKFTARGSVKLHLGLAADRARLRFEVADTGPGILAEHRDRLFQEFERLDADSRGMVEGAGLGLAIAAPLTVALGGRLGYEDNSGGGSVFWLELPLAPTSTAVPFPRAALPPDVREPAPVSDSALRLLVVDDIAMNRDIAGAFLHGAGHEVTYAEGGAEAVAAVAAADFDLVLMDVRMPEVDGLEATRRIRALGGVRGHVLIVALTAHSFTEQVMECRSAGMNGHLAKPFTPDTLRDAIALAIEEGGARSEPRRTEATCDDATGPISSPAPPASSEVGSELPILDPVAFGQTAAFLSSEVIAHSMQTLAGSGEALHSRLQGWDAAATKVGIELAHAAHVLSGSAGMFGFRRLADAARGFEHAVQTGGKEAPVLAHRLSAAVETALPEIRNLTLAGVKV